MTQEHAKYEQEVIYGTTYDIYKYINIYIYRKFAANSSMWGSLTLAPIIVLYYTVRINLIYHLVNQSDWYYTFFSRYCCNRKLIGEYFA